MGSWHPGVPRSLQVCGHIVCDTAIRVRPYSRNRITFGDDVKMMLERHLTFEAAIGSDEFGLLSKQRLALVRRDRFEQLDNLRLVL